MNKWVNEWIYGMNEFMAVVIYYITDEGIRAVTNGLPQQLQSLIEYKYLLENNWRKERKIAENSCT